MNSENSKTSEPQELIKRLLHDQILAFITHEIILKAHTIIIN